MIVYSITAFTLFFNFYQVILKGQFVVLYQVYFRWIIIKISKEFKLLFVIWLWWFYLKQDGDNRMLINYYTAGCKMNGLVMVLCPYLRNKFTSILSTTWFEAAAFLSNWAELGIQLAKMAIIPWINKPCSFSENLIKAKYHFDF